VKLLITCRACGASASCTCAFAPDGLVATCKVCADQKVPLDIQMELFSPMPDSQLISKQFHFVWIGDNPIPQKNLDWMATWPRLNPDWKATLWATNVAAQDHAKGFGLDVQPLPPLVNQWAYENISKWVSGRATIAAQSDIVRMDIVAQFGGVYLDTDVEAFKPLGNCLDNVRLFYADEFGPCQPNYFYGSVANHPALWNAVRGVKPRLLASTQTVEGQEDKIPKPLNALDACGPNYLAPKLRESPECVIFDSVLFSPLWARADATTVSEWPAVSIANHHFDGFWYSQNKEPAKPAHTQGAFTNISGKREPTKEPLYPSPWPKIGLVIGTYNRPAHVHLGLESARRFLPHVPVLVVHDGPGESGRLGPLCSGYGVGVTLAQTKERLGHRRGDWNVFAHGLDWAKKNGLDLLVKISNRRVPLYNWTGELSRLAFAAQYPTYSSVDLNIGWGFRTDYLAMHVASWLPMQARITAFAGAPDDGNPQATSHVEYKMHGLAREVHHLTRCEKNARLEEFEGGLYRGDSFGFWFLGGTSRVEADPSCLWHGADSPARFAEQASEWGLKKPDRSGYEAEDFS